MTITIAEHRARVRYLTATAAAYDTDTPAAWAEVEAAERSLTAAKQARGRS